jgi:hypothetical protein
MSKINSTKKIIIEEFPAEVQGWLKKLVEPLNRFLEQTYYALVNGITVADNLKAQVNTLTVQPNQPYPMKYTWNVNERPTIVLLASIQDNSGAAVPTHSMNWVYNNGTVEITLSGLTAANKYTIKLLGLV